MERGLRRMSLAGQTDDPLCLEYSSVATTQDPTMHFRDCSPPMRSALLPFEHSWTVPQQQIPLQLTRI
eukprot:4295982-Karenia_brevis.AAC.1